MLAAVARRQEQGFDAVWWADHLLHWFPTSIWVPDLVPQAAAQASPHVWMDPFTLVAASASAADRLRFGVGVTDLVRRHPAALAQTAMTLDHVTKGRFILGVGPGEALNLSPLGMANAHPVARLEEGLEAMRLLFATPDEVDFEVHTSPCAASRSGCAPSVRHRHRSGSRRTAPAASRRGSSWRRMAAPVSARRGNMQRCGPPCRTRRGPPDGRPSAVAPGATRALWSPRTTRPPTDRARVAAVAVHRPDRVRRGVHAPRP